EPASRQRDHEVDRSEIPPWLNPPTPGHGEEPAPFSAVLGREARQLPPPPRRRCGASLSTAGAGKPQHTRLGAEASLPRHLPPGSTLAGVLHQVHRWSELRRGSPQNESSGL